MTGPGFERLVRQAFAPFLTRLGMAMGGPFISGRVYLVHFTGGTHKVSVSYEPGDERLLITVSRVAQGVFSDYDDRAKTLRLGDLNARYMKFVTKEERLANEAAFSSIVAEDKDELLLLKAAKELCLVLPKFLGDAQSPTAQPGD